MKKILAFLLLGVVAVAPLEARAMGTSRNDKIAEIQGKAKTIDASDEISKEEAVLIAQNALIENEDEDVDILHPSIRESWLIKGCWAVTFNVSRRFRSEHGLKWFAVHIDKKDGKIMTSGPGPV